MNVDDKIEGLYISVALDGDGQYRIVKMLNDSEIEDRGTVSSLMRAAYLAGQWAKEEGLEVKP